ncbi:unnamed protein product [Protopolystoma xenopodis]|uniref:Uncharacterized protein n=1 Tax=Protopolystoma xenopodis TaxID=117903 RepID=A0A448WTT9_9PLAT|nr:unnamed protein product [Protopolystoma xenopodis]
MVRDGEGLLPLNIALRQHIKPCASFLLAKQWCRVPYKQSSLSLLIFASLRNWADIARDRVQAASALAMGLQRRRPHATNRICPLLVYSVVSLSLNPTSATSFANSPHPVSSFAPKSPKSVSLQVDLVKHNHLHHRFQMPFAELQDLSF